MFDFVHHEGALQGTKVVDVAKNVQNELLIVFHVGRMDFQQIVVTARDVVTFGDFRDAAHHTGEIFRYLAPDAAHLHTAKHNETTAKLFCIEHGHIAFDIAPLLQTLDALENGCGREIDHRRQLLGGEAGIFLQGTENFHVNGIQQLCFLHLFPFILFWNTEGRQNIFP